MDCSHAMICTQEFGLRNTPSCPVSWWIGTPTSINGGIACQSGDSWEYDFKKLRNNRIAWQTIRAKTVGSSQFVELVFFPPAGTGINRLRAIFWFIVRRCWNKDRQTLIPIRMLSLQTSMENKWYSKSQVNLGWVLSKSYPSWQVCPLRSVHKVL